MKKIVQKIQIPFQIGRNFLLTFDKFYSFISVQTRKIVS